VTSTARDQARRLPAEPGVYRFRDELGRVLYSGRATSLRSRVGSYFTDVRDRPHLLRMVTRIRRVEALVCASVHEACWLERNLHTRSLPRWNRAAAGQEVPHYVRVDLSQTTPSVTAVHRPDAQGGLLFGPFLGGWKVRTALSGLHRVLPLSYAGTRMASSEQDLADLRQVSPADHDRLLHEVTAVLGGDQEAIARTSALLVVLRDEASQGQRYEQARRIQDEVACLDWITAEQRVASMDPVDASAAGWCDGLLLRLEIRHGLLDGWRQLACTRATAERHLAATPSAWTAFATINAELAARLRG
jgi:excinuclease ABC subunit C